MHEPGTGMDAEEIKSEKILHHAREQETKFKHEKVTETVGLCLSLSLLTQTLI